MLYPLLKKSSFLLTVLFLSLLCFALKEAKADVKGIPFNARFQSASYPYARQVDNCTAWRKPDRLNDSWGAVSFSGACRIHDRCFHTPGSSWGECNEQFLIDMKKACDRDLERQRLEKGQHGRPDDQALALCYDIANIYFGKVQTAEAQKRHELAQAQEQEYLKYVSSVVNQVYKDVLRRPATSQEKDRALATLARDYSLDDLKAALMGERMEADRTAGADPMPPVDDTAENAAFVPQGD